MQENSRKTRPDFRSRPVRKQPGSQNAVLGHQQVAELLQQHPGKVHRVLFQKDSGHVQLYELQKKVRKLHIHYQQLDLSVLDSYGKGHNGVVALCHEQEILPWETLREHLADSMHQGTPEIVVVLSNLEDPRNLGAILRSCLALGAQTVLLPSRGTCGLTPVVARASAGSLEKITLCKPNSLESALQDLKALDYQITGLDAAPQHATITSYSFDQHCVICLGGEDKNLPPYLRKRCDHIVAIPMAPSSHSYNASVALSLALYELQRQKNFVDILTAPSSTTSDT